MFCTGKYYRSGQCFFAGDGGGILSIIPEELGNTLKREEVKQAVLDAVDSGKTQINLEEMDLYEKPAVLPQMKG